MPIIARAKSMVGFVVSRVLPIPIPRVVGSTTELGALCKEMKVTTVLVVTDAIVSKLGLLDTGLESLKEAGVNVVIFDKVMPDPTVDICDEGFEIYLKNKCNGVICVGGGSVMDCAKLIAIRATNPSKSSKDFMGTLTVLTTLPPFIAVPTTAGTGSETTIAAVISFPKEQKKYTVIDPNVCPHVAILDPTLLTKLPPAITAATGMDALTHAVESYISPWRSTLTGERSLSAIKNIFKYLKPSYEDPLDLEARGHLLQASFDAGVAFTRANVGYVHAIAHQLGALFKTPHGLANAMVLSNVLDFYRDSCERVFAEMAVAAELGSSSASPRLLADRFVAAVKQLGIDLKIPSYVKGLTLKDVDNIATRALNEAHGDSYSILSSPIKYMLDTGYPTARYMDHSQCAAIVEVLVDPSTMKASL